MSASSSSSFLDAFRRKAQVLALSVPSSLVDKVTKPLRHHSIKRPLVRPVQPHPQEANRRILLLDERFVLPESVPVEINQLLQDHADISLVPFTIELTPENFSLEELMRAVVPEPVELPSAYEQVGHIAHINLRPEQLPYKHAIGEALMAKSRTIKTVVNKLKNVHAVFRTFDMEVIAGEDRFDVEVIESNCRFCFNYREVYWNSRLQEEHRRLVEACAASDVLCDMFAGVGPFAIPAAKRGLRVLANDLNPASYKYLIANAKRNKVQVDAFNLDARDFVRHLCGPDKREFPFSVVVMNLPKDAVEFLDVFVGCMPHLGAGASCPTIYCYAFCKPEEQGDVLSLSERVWRALDVHNEEDAKPELDIRKVRNISPKKFMYCVKFVLPPSVATRSPEKRRRTEEKQ